MFIFIIVQKLLMKNLIFEYKLIINTVEETSTDIHKKNFQNNQKRSGDGADEDDHGKLE